MKPQVASLDFILCLDQFVPLASSPLLIIGSGGHAHALLALLERHQGFRPLGFIDPMRPAHSLVFGLPILGSESDLPFLCSDLGVDHLLVAIGDNFQRQRVAQSLKVLLPSVCFPTLIDPSAVVSSASQLADGCVILAGAHVGPGCILEEGVIVNTHASVDHDGTLSQFSSLAPAAVTGGRVLLGARSFLGIGAHLNHQLTIGNDTVVGAGAAVVSDLPSEVLAYGVPARVIRRRSPDEAYL